MKVKKEFIGSRRWSPVMKRIVNINSDQADIFISLGIVDIYETEKSIQSKKDNVKNNKKRDNDTGGDDNGTDNNSESELSV